MADKPLAPKPPERTTAPRETSHPDIRVAYTPAGRETLDAITEELVPLPLPALEREDSSPDIQVRETFAERDTLAAIIAEAAPPAEPTAPAPRASPSAAARPMGAEVFEMITFVVRGVEAARLSSEALRRRFVEERLMTRLPAASMDDVERVDVTPWTTQGTLVVRVWCRLPAPG